MPSLVLPRAPRYLVLAVAGAVAVTGCSSGGSSTAEPTPRPSVAEIDVEVTSAGYVSDVEPRAELDATIEDDVVDVVERFLEATMAEPLAVGALGEVDQLLTADAAERLRGEDATALVDLGAARATTVDVERADVALTGLGGALDAQVMVAGIDVVLVGRDADGAEVVSVHRSGELTLTPVDGGWRISGYDVDVEREARTPEVAS